MPRACTHLNEPSAPYGPSKPTAKIEADRDGQGTSRYRMVEVRSLVAGR
jgi:hypothetical protein